MRRFNLFVIVLVILSSYQAFAGGPQCSGQIKTADGKETAIPAMDAKTQEDCIALITTQTKGWCANSKTLKEIAFEANWYLQVANGIEISYGFSGVCKPPISTVFGLLSSSAKIDREYVKRF